MNNPSIRFCFSLVLTAFHNCSLLLRQAVEFIHQLVDLPLQRAGVRIGEISAVFERLIFQPEPSRWEASETDRRAERGRVSGSERVKMSRLSWQLPS